MKTTHSLVCALAFLVSTSLPLAAGGDPSGPPERLSYQGYLVDENGAPLGVDGDGNPLPSNYDVRFSIYDQSTGGRLLWREQQTITVDAGYFSVLLGEGTPAGNPEHDKLSSVFTGSDAAERFIGVDVRLAAGGEFSEILPRLRLLTSPYAFSAKQARSVVDHEGTALITAEAGNVTISGSLSGARLYRTEDLHLVDNSEYHGLGWYGGSNKSFAGEPKGGPVLYGNNGGILGARRSSDEVEIIALEWFNNGNVHVTNNLTVGGFTILSEGARLNDKNLNLRSDGTGMGNNGLGWYGDGKKFATEDPNAVVLYGWEGGMLGSRKGSVESERFALRWTHEQDVHVTNNLTVGGLTTLSDVEVTNNLTVEKSTNLKDGAWLWDKDLYLRGSGTNNGLGFYGGNIEKPFGTESPAGPVLYGNQGGILGTKSGSTEKIALKWNNNKNVTVGNNLTVDNNLTVGRDLTVGIDNLLSITRDSWDGNRAVEFRTNPAEANRNHRFRWINKDQTNMTLHQDGNLTLHNGTLSESSDRNQKENIESLQSTEVLKKVVDLPISEWSYIGQTDRHIGPMAQDFHASFGLGSDDVSLSSSNVAGVSILAIQGLHETVKAQETEITGLRDAVADLQATVATLLEAQASDQ